MSGRATSGDNEGWKRGNKGFATSKDDGDFDARKGSANKGASKKMYGPTGGADLIAIEQCVGDGKNLTERARR